MIMKEQLTPEEIAAMMTTSMVVPLHDGNPLDLALKEFLEFHRMASGRSKTDANLAWNMVIASHKIHNIALEIFHLEISDMSEKIDE
jgi:hypothetical protein